MKYLSIFLGIICSNFQHCSATSLNDVLPDPYPQVYDTVELMAFDAHGWYIHHNKFQSLISNNQVKVAIEVGSWLGASTRDIAKMLPEDGVIYSVDTWQGSVEHQPGASNYYIPNNLLFSQFLSNVIHAGLQNKIIPVRLSSVEAALQLAPLNLKADFIYIDAAHDYESVKQDLYCWYPYLKEGGIFCGDDYPYEPTGQAVRDFAKENNLTLTFDSCWILSK